MNSPSSGLYILPVTAAVHSFWGAVVALDLVAQPVHASVYCALEALNCLSIPARTFCADVLFVSLKKGLEIVLLFCETIVGARAWTARSASAAEA